MAAKVRLLIAYEGTRYRGWQVQPDEPTIQGTLEEAFTKMTGLTTRFGAAGRTDAGVHAAGQVVCFENLSRHEPRALQAGLNALLPDDIAVLESEPAADDFDPREQAVGKHYRYRIFNSRVRPVFERLHSLHIKKPLDLDAMRTALKPLIGQHDFSSFRAAGCEAKSPVRTIDRIDLRAHGPVLNMDVWGSGFLRQMVRNLTGTLVEVGRGLRQPAEMKDILEARDRTRAGQTALALGLCLMRVFFEASQYQLILDNPNEFP